jgi:hypothetical protein
MRSEMITLIDKLDSANIPYVAETDFFGATHVMYPESWEGDCKCSVICHEYSMGGKEGLLEIMGLVDEDCGDDVQGYLTANDVFARIYTDYINSAD